MSAIVSPALAAHVRSGRFVQHENAAANIPSRIRARRIASGAQFCGPRAKVSWASASSTGTETTAEKLCSWILNRLSGTEE